MYSPRHCRAASSQIPSTPRLRSGRKVRIQLGMAALVFAHDLPGPVGGEVIGDQHLELERRRWASALSIAAPIQAA